MTRGTRRAQSVNLTVQWASVRDHVGTAERPDLSLRERERAAGITDPYARSHFVAGCRLMRSVVCLATRSQPSAVRIERTCPDCGRAHGRPQVTLLEAGGAQDSRQVSVSLSHAGDWVVAAAGVGAGIGIGIDIEVLRRYEGASQIRSRVFHPNEQGQITDSALSTDFLRSWVRKESLVKATGEGLRLPLSGIWLSQRRLIGWDEHPELVDDATISDVETPPGLVGALAVVSMRSPAPVHPVAVQDVNPRRD